MKTIAASGRLGVLAVLLAMASIASAAAPAPGQTTLTAILATRQDAGVRDLCIFATGDPRDGQWTLARIAFSRGDARGASF